MRSHRDRLRPTAGICVDRMETLHVIPQGLCTSVVLDAFTANSPACDVLLALAEGVRSVFAKDLMYTRTFAAGAIGGHG